MSRRRVGAVDPGELGARRHDRAHRLVGQPQHALDHVALLGLQHAGLRALGQQRLQLLLGHRLLRRRGASPNSRSTSAEDWPSSQTTGADDARQRWRSGRRPAAAITLRPAQRELLGHQFAQHQGQVGDHDHHDGRATARSAKRRQIRECRASAAWICAGDPRAAEHAGQDADQGDADLHRGQEALRVLGQRRAPRRRPARPCAPAPPAGRGAPRPAPVRSSRTRRSAGSADRMTTNSRAIPIAGSTTSRPCVPVMLARSGRHGPGGAAPFDRRAADGAPSAMRDPRLGGLEPDMAVARRPTPPPIGGYAGGSKRNRAPEFWPAPKMQTFTLG